MKKRGDGEGSLYFDDEKGLWVASITVGYVDGIVIASRASFCDLKRSRFRRRRMRRELDTGIERGDDKLSVRRFMQRWLAEHVEGPLSMLRPSTRASYTTLTNKHIVPSLGHHVLSKLSPLHLQAFLSAKLRSGLSPRTVQYLHAVEHRVERRL